MIRASFAIGVLLVGCARPTPTAETPQKRPAAAASTVTPALVPLVEISSGPKAPWREPAMLTTPRHPLADPRVIALRDGKARVRTVNAVVWVRGVGGVESVEAVAPSVEEHGAPPDCAETRPYLASWARLVEPTSLATLRAPLPATSAVACTPPPADARVRTAAPGAATSPCELAECVRGTTDPEPELTRTQLSLAPGRCNGADADATGACRVGAVGTHPGDAVLADLEARGVRFLAPPTGCIPARASAIGGLPLLVCAGETAALWAATPEGGWRSEGTLPVPARELGAVALASDGTVLVRASWSDAARRRAFVRAPRAAGDGSAWRELALGDALEVRVAPRGGALFLRALDGGRALAIELDAVSGRSVITPRVALTAHVVDVSVERTKLVLWMLPTMHRGRPPAGSVAARGAAEAFAIARDGSLQRLPSIELPSAQIVDRARHVGRRRAHESEALPRSWMDESEHLGVERLATERDAEPAHPRVARLPAVDAITEDGRERDLGEVDTDLMRPSRLERAADERAAARGKALDRRDVGDGALASSHPRREAKAIGGVATVERRDRLRADGRGRDREVTPLDVVCLKEHLEPLARPLVLRDDHHAARVLVEAMDDSRARILARLACFDREREAAAREEPVDEGALEVAARRVDDEASRLVEDDQAFVLEHHREAHRCVRHELRRRRLARRDFDPCAEAHRVRCATGSSVDEDAALVDPTLHHRAARVLRGTLARPALRDHAIEPRPRLSARHDEDERSALAHQIFDFTWPFDLIKMSTSARS